MDVCSYSPQISPGNSNLTPMPEDPPVDLAFRNSVILYYPWDTPTTTLEIRNPEYNDKLVAKQSRIERLSRGNDLIIFRDTQWPAAKIINYNFIGLTRQQADDALAFFLLTCGKYVKLLTYESLSYKGILLNPKNPISQEGKNDCSYTLKVDFQGSLI